MNVWVSFEKGKHLCLLLSSLLLFYFLCLWNVILLDILWLSYHTCLILWIVFQSRMCFCSGECYPKPKRTAKWVGSTSTSIPCCLCRKDPSHASFQSLFFIINHIYHFLINFKYVKQSINQSISPAISLSTCCSWS